MALVLTDGALADPPDPASWWPAPRPENRVRALSDLPGIRVRGNLLEIPDPVWQSGLRLRRSASELGYDPTTAQFLSVDPLVAVTRSPYGYVGGNPVNSGDPTGLCDWFAVLVCGVQGAAGVVHDHVIAPTIDLATHLCIGSSATCHTGANYISDWAQSTIPGARTALNSNDPNESFGSKVVGLFGLDKALVGLTACGGGIVLAGGSAALIPSTDGLSTPGAVLGGGASVGGFDLLLNGLDELIHG
jgi:hypothetical protein